MNNIFGLLLNLYNIKISEYLSNLIFLYYEKSINLIYFCFTLSIFKEDHKYLNSKNYILKL
jgi:hypothetical protein